MALHRLDHIHFAGIESPTPRRRRLAAQVEPPVPVLPRSTRIASRFADSVEVDPFVLWLLAQAGLDAEAYRASALQRRFPACLRHLRVESGPAARALLERHPELFPKALSVLLIGMTGFFRDRSVFERLPALLDELMRTRSGLQVYSAGASDGRELYSIAMLLEERGLLSRSRLIGVDCRSDAMHRARQGWFEASELDGLEVKWRLRDFRPEGNGYRIKSKLRYGIEWRSGDLFTHRENDCDLILFRNVAIYFRPLQAARAWDLLHRQLVPGGFLVTGKAEKPPAALGFRTVAPSIYQKMPLPAPASPDRAPQLSSR